MTDEPSAKNFWKRLNNLVLVRFLLLFACGWAIVEVLAYFETVVVIFTSASILAFLLNQPVKQLSRFLPHNLAVMIVFLSSVILIVTITVTSGLVISSQGQNLAESLADFLSSINPTFEGVGRFLRARNLQINLQGLEERLRDQVLVGIGSSLPIIPILLANLVTLIFTAVITFFMLLDGERLWSFVLRTFLPVHWRDRFNIAVQRSLLGFFGGQLLLCLFFAGSSFIVFVVLQVSFPLVLAIIVGSLDLIPGIGATLGIGLVTLILLSQSFWLAVKVMVSCIVIQQIKENLLLPRIMQNSLNINPVVIFFSLLVGARIGGLLGLFLAIPAAGVVVSLLSIEEMQSRVPVSSGQDNII